MTNKSVNSSPPKETLIQRFWLGSPVINRTTYGLTTARFPQKFFMGTEGVVVGIEVP